MNHEASPVAPSRRNRGATSDKNTDNIHIANILDGPLQEEGDDLSDRFEPEAPWDTDSQSGELPSLGLISLIDIQGSDTFKNKIQSVCQRYKHYFSQAV